MMTNLDNIHFGGEVKRFFDLPIFNRVRCSDPVTSYEAADSAKDLASKHFSIIVDCLKAHGALGKDGIAKHSGLDSNQVARRLNELHNMELICLTGRTVKSKSGRNEREWEVKSVK
jgi:transcription initiation factor IIE alpha subunit